jgi:3-oxoacyl-[acyl-carrier-protein] synthase II
MSAAPRVVVTGLGIVSPIGIGRNEFASSLHAGRSGVRLLHSFDATGLPVRIGAEIEHFDPRDYVEKKDRKHLKMMVRAIQFAVAGARLALNDAGIVPGRVDPERLGIIFGTGTISGELADLAPAAQASYDDRAQQVDLTRWGRDGLPLIPPMWMLNHVPNMLACHAAILNDARGPNNTITQSDASGLLSVGEALRILRGGRADLMLAGGAATHTDPLTLARFALFSQLSRRNDAPEAASRPFDIDRDGQVLGEGGGVLLLETLEHAQRRQARIDAELVGYAAGFDGGRSGRGLARVLCAALKSAGITPDEIDHMNAHAPATRDDDPWEARAVQQAFTPGRTVPVVALKSYFGNLGPAAAVTELAASLLALSNGTVPATLNHGTTDPACPVEVIRTPRPLERPYFLKVSCTECGQCAAAVFRRWEEAAA